MDNNIIAVYGSPGSYKTTTALSLARCIASKGSNVVIVGTSTIKPLLPIAVPFESKFSGSLGKALSAIDFDRDVILKNIFMATDKIGILSYNIRENGNSYAVVSPDRMDDLFIQLRQQRGAQIIVDCTSDIVNSKLTAKAIMKNLLKRLKSTRGEGYIDVSVAVLIIMILLAGVIKIAPVFITKMTLNSYANELCREAEIAGRIGTETTARLDQLNESHPDLDPTVTWSASGNIQIGRTFSVTVSTNYDFSFFVFNTTPITISATAEGTSEVFWK